jgi:hypothetical protein
MPTQNSTRRLGFLALAALMAATRFGNCGSAWALPDASWAVFFIAGFYLASQWRWALPALLVEAVAIDFAAIHYYGVSDYCVTAAYWFILPAYSILWLGGAWLNHRYQKVPADLRRLAISVALSVSACFLLTEGSFYWLGGRIAHASIGGWWSNFLDWYGYFMLVTAGYVALAALGHIAVTRRLPARAHLQTR